MTLKFEVKLSSSCPFVTGLVMGPTRIAENRITETGVFVKNTELPK